MERERELLATCDYCRGVLSGAEDWFVPMYRGDKDGVGSLCSPNCQLAYSFYRVDPNHRDREPWIRAQHRGVRYAMAPSPYNILRVNRDIWYKKKEREDHPTISQ